MQTDAVLSEWVFCLTIAGSHVIGFEKLMFNTACDFVCFFFLWLSLENAMYCTRTTTNVALLEVQNITS